MRRKFGVLVDSFEIKLWQYRAIERIIEQTNYELCLVVLNGTKRKESIKISNLFFFIYKLIFVRSKESQKMDLRELVGDSTEIITCAVTKKGKFSEYFSDGDIHTIEQFNLDFALRFGYGIIRGKILNTFKYGVWSFHHGDEKKYRGGPYCFWEIYKRDYVNGAILQVLTSRLDGGIILKKGYFKTQLHSYGKNIDQALRLSSEWPSQICTEIENGTFKKDLESSQTDAPIYLLPNNLQMLLFACKILKNKLVNFYYFYLTYDHWHVGVLDKGVEEVVKNGFTSDEVKWLEGQSNNYFVADPFIFEYEGVKKLALEYLSYKDFVGRIDVYSGSKFETEVVGFFENKPYHLSYPNFFQFEENFFCLPEAFSSNQLILFEKIEDRWMEHVLIDNMKAIDPEIIFHEEMYYLFLTEKGDDHDTKLKVYFSKNLRSDWSPHPCNPVNFDVRSARGAGKIFKTGNDIFRPGQNYSIHKEGSITISKVNKLTPLEYEEEIMREILPIKNCKYSDKIHTINSVNGITVIDACRIKSFVLRPDIFLSLLRSKL